ncbi:hypothetical protein R1flu_020047 [Riccia fluitans]|uniref:Uncharacterized protein n=1 Tax=Riccia fluitans TaxID=41844 RepID=A0ABD1ZP83_9MARC
MVMIHFLRDSSFKHPSPNRIGSIGRNRRTVRSIRNNHRTVSTIGKHRRRQREANPSKELWVCNPPHVASRPRASSDEPTPLSRKTGIGSIESTPIEKLQRPSRNYATPVESTGNKRSRIILNPRDEGNHVFYSHASS